MTADGTYDNSVVKSWVATRKMELLKQQKEHAKAAANHAEAQQYVQAVLAQHGVQVAAGVQVAGDDGMGL